MTIIVLSSENSTVYSIHRNKAGNAQPHIRGLYMFFPDNSGLGEMAAEISDEKVDIQSVSMVN